MIKTMHVVLPYDPEKWEEEDLLYFDGERADEEGMQ